MKDSGNSEIQWIMKFHENKLQTFQHYPHQAKPEATVHITVGPPKNEDAKSSPQENVESKPPQLESLEEIVEACKEFKDKVKESHDKKSDEATKSIEISENLKTLYQLILEFTKIMRKLRFGEDNSPPKNP